MSRLLALFLCLWGTLASAATLLPNGKQVFVDGNGAPLAGGSVTFYAPNTTTPKQTWQDSGSTTLNTNPVTLDSNGSAIIYGSGSYREIVQDASGNVIWDQLTADTSSTQQSWAATSTGTANVQIVAGVNFTSSDGQTIWFRAGYTNTSSLTINPNAYGPLLVYKDTTSGPVQLTGGEVASGNIVGVVYDAILGGFHLASSIPATQSASTLASASTTDLGTASSSLINITGATTISSFGSTATTAAPIYNLHFQSALALVNSSSLVLPSGTNTVLAAGSWVLAQYTGSGVWDVLAISQGDGSSSVPSGAVLSFNLASCPAGWKQADGINANPDLRGYFVRGLDTGGSIDPSRSLASVQGDQLQDHTHGNPSGGQFLLQGTGGGPLAGGGSFTYTESVSTSTMATGNHGSETRPKNVALLYCVKN